MKGYDENSILEVGNVLSHFFEVHHEIAIGVINQDIVNYNPSKKYNLIVTISTLEHVGWNETTHEPLKIMRAIKKLKSLMTTSGKIVITLPNGYSPVLDNIFRKNKLDFSEQYFFKRKSRKNKWKQVNWKKISKLVYGYLIRYSANRIVVGIIK